MFACETILKNSNIATLEMFNNQPRWWIKDALLTERAFYLFQEKGDLLGDEYGNILRVLSNDDETMPSYVKQLPPFKTPYTHLIEMHNKKTQKRRILACESAVQAEEFVNLFNLVNSYLNYELLFTSTDQNYHDNADMNEQMGENANGQQSGQQSQRSGPAFITNWVQTYNSHSGVMEFKEEVFDPDNFPYLLSFARENESVKSLVFPGESLIFAGNEQRILQAIQQILSTFSRESITQIIFRGNFMVDFILKNIIPSMAQYERLNHIEISSNGLTNKSLESLGMVFSNCPLISKINLSGNLLGQGANQQQSLDIFLTHMLTELDNPQYLDLSDNKFSDESLHPFIKLIFANEECRLLMINLENNNFSSFGKRTLLKGYSLCVNKQQLQFKCGPMPFTEATLKHAFNVQYESKVVSTGKAKEVETQKVLKSINNDKLEIRITRRPNYGTHELKGLPISRSDRDRLHEIFAKIENTVQQRNSIYIEDIRDLLQEISQLTFEFPRHKLEPLFDVVNEKLFQSMECENIYCLEILLDCLRFMNGRNLKAEEKYAELSLIASSVAKDLVKVLNMELLDDNELNAMLDNALNEAKRIGMRGELIDVAVTLKMLRDNFLTEMQNKSTQSDDESNPGFGEDQQQLEFYDEDKTMNVYDEKYDVYIEMGVEELGLTSEVEPNLGFHPLSSDYLKISNLNLNYVKKNLKEAQKFLRDEESYAYRNIFDRCYFLLCDSTDESSQHSKAYNLAKNDSNLKIARLIFRYKNNLDNLFPPKLEPYPHTIAVKSTDVGRKSVLSGQKSDENKLYQYKYLLAKEYIEFNGTKLTHPVTKIDKNKAPVAVMFNRSLFSICESDDITKNSLYGKLQELFEEFVVKKGKILNEDLQDEFFLQIFRQINRKNFQQSEKSAKAIANALFVLALYSRYATPSKDLIEGYEQWLNSLRDKTGAEFFRLISIIINNFNIVKKVDNNTKPYVNWPPCFAEIESVITGEPIQINVYTPIGDVFQYTIDETTTVESLLTQFIWKEKFFAKEPDAEFYWLYQHVEKSDQFDIPLSKDKKILKLLYKNEKSQEAQQRKSGYFSESEGSPSPAKRYSFIKKKSAKFLRKQTMFASMDALNDNEYQSTIFLVKKRIFSALHLDQNVRTLSRKPLNFLYHQIRMDYIDKNILRRLSNYEDVSLFAALILKVKYWGKILRSKDNSLTKDLIIKNIDYAIPQTFLREKSQDYWVTRIQKDFDRKKLRELSIEEAQERFLTQFANYSLAYSSYYVMKATQDKDNQNDESLMKQSDILDDIESEMSMMTTYNRESIFHMHTNHDILCVINFNGLSFYDNTKRDKPIHKINFEDLLYVMGSGQVLKFGFINRGVNQLKTHDVRIELYATYWLNARSIAEDILTYCQLRLAECTKNESIEIVKRNIINIFEDMEDPFEDDVSPNRSLGNNTFRKSSNHLKMRRSNMGDFDFLGEGEGSPDRASNVDYHNNAKQLQHKLMQQRGHQFRLKEKFLVYLRKYPLYIQKTLNTDRSSGSPDSPISRKRRSDSSIKGSFASAGSNRAERQSMFKLQLSTVRIEEDRNEDDDDSSSKGDHKTGDDSTPHTKDRLPLSDRSGSSNPFNAKQQSPMNNFGVRKPTNKVSDNQQVNTFQQMPPFESKKTNFSFRGQLPRASMQQNNNSQSIFKNTRLESESQLEESPNFAQATKNQHGQPVSSSQQAVINELFRNKQTIENRNTLQKGNIPSQISQDVDVTEEAKVNTEDEEGDGTAMVLGQKVNYEEMDKTQKKENLNNILSAAFNFLPPPPK